MSTCGTPDHERGLPDRRSKPISLSWTGLWAGRRMENRRASDRQHHYAVDRFGVVSLALVILLLIFSVIDGGLTLHLLDHGCKEINPVMEYLLTKGMVSFLVGKYILTAAGLPILLVFKNYPLFGTGFRVGYLLPVFVGLYSILLCYQWSLLQAA